MVNATLTRGSTSIDIRLEEEAGEILCASSFGKPEVNVRQSGGTGLPRVSDEWSGLQNFELVGKLYDYGTSHDLAELVQAGSTTPLTLSVPDDVYPDSITVAPAAGQDGALSLSYPSGRKDLVDVNLNLTRVGQVYGVGVQDIPTPRASGSGPVQVRIDGTTVDLPTSGLSLERTVGRPNDAVRRVPRQADPRYEVKAKVTSDVFTFSFETLENIPSTLNALTDNIFRTQLGREGVTIDFNGVLGLGAIEGIPVGSSPFRQVHSAGRDWVTSPTLSFRRIYSDG